jgi:hypothetical protein
LELGAFYGVNAIPKEWREKLALLPLLQAFAEELLLLSDRLGDSNASAPLSKTYQDTQGCYKMLETAYKPILRKLLPGPHAYKKLSDFEQDEENFQKVYLANAPEECPHKRHLLADYLRIFEDEKIKLQRKLGAPSRG